MLDDGGQLLVSPVDHEIKDGIKRVVKYLETAHKVKAKKVEIKKMKKSLALWLANMTSPDGKDFAHELANRKGRISLGWEFVKWFTRTGSHTFIALVTAAFESLKFKHGSEERSTLIQQSRELYQEFKVNYRNCISSIYYYKEFEKSIFFSSISSESNYLTWK